MLLIYSHSAISIIIYSIGVHVYFFIPQFQNIFFFQYKGIRRFIKQMQSDAYFCQLKTMSKIARSGILLHNRTEYDHTPEDGTCTLKNCLKI